MKICGFHFFNFLNEQHVALYHSKLFDLYCTYYVFCYAYESEISKEWAKIVTIFTI